ncbi:hypothetical protein C8J57DRAFT_1503441 [Mycena rebaudengoi]|nr:hypothetical protein C8J57DRAFT_1503441 [Mycena rebaudengoi]
MRVDTYPDNPIRGCANRYASLSTPEDVHARAGQIPVGCPRPVLAWPISLVDDAPHFFVDVPTTGDPPELLLRPPPSFPILYPSAPLPRSTTTLSPSMVMQFPFGEPAFAIFVILSYFIIRCLFTL